MCMSLRALYQEEKYTIVQVCFHGEGSIFGLRFSRSVHVTTTLKASFRRTSECNNYRLRR
jgi:hypothetical protein